MYWIAVVVGFGMLGYSEKAGHWPMMRAKTPSGRKGSDTTSEEAAGVAYSPKAIDEKRMETSVAATTS